MSCSITLILEIISEDFNYFRVSKLVNLWKIRLSQIKVLQYSHWCYKALVSISYYLYYNIIITWSSCKLEWVHCIHNCLCKKNDHDCQNVFCNIHYRPEHWQRRLQRQNRYVFWWAPSLWGQKIRSVIIIIHKDYMCISYVTLKAKNALCQNNELESNCMLYNFWSTYISGSSYRLWWREQCH